jgi:uncharacterized protein (TIGR02246 family)
MKPMIALALVATTLASAASAQSDSAAARRASSAAIDAEVWTVISATVVNADIDGMAATYHPDAVVVTPGRTVPAREQLPKWGKDMADAKPRRETATVEFRFSRRVDDATTAFEAGMFKYTVTDSAGKSVAYHIPMEVLLVRWNGRWRILMERQFAVADAAAWNELAP